MSSLSLEECKWDGRETGPSSFHIIHLAWQTAVALCFVSSHRALESHSGVHKGRGWVWTQTPEPQCSLIGAPATSQGPSSLSAELFRQHHTTLPGMPRRSLSLSWVMGHSRNHIRPMS